MQIKVQTIIRTIVLAVALINQTLIVMGKNPLPITDEQLNQFFGIGFTMLASIWSWWKNNSFTKNAMRADRYLKMLNSMSTN